MTDRPILFSTPMVRALLDGRKSQTRRLLSSQPPEGARYAGIHHAFNEPDTWFFNSPRGPFKVRQRFFEGDRLWVREAWRTFVSLDAVPPRDIWSPDQARGAGVAFEAGGGLSITKADRQYHYGDARDDIGAFGKLRPAMFMPRWASRLTLAVTDVRVERLQEISEGDAIAEGVERPILPHWRERPFASAYRGLWNDLHGADAWAANPWVVALTFTAVRANIDSLNKSEAA